MKKSKHGVVDFVVHILLIPNNATSLPPTANTAVVLNEAVFKKLPDCVKHVFAPFKSRQDYFQVVLQVDIISYKNGLKCSHCLIGASILSGATNVMVLTILAQLVRRAFLIPDPQQLMN